MLSSSTLGVLFGAFLVISSIPDAASYTKYGRTCKDIGCRRDEVCVMAEDPCSIYQRDNCGRYPTCAKSRPGEASCASTVCAENEYCKTENGVPTCVKRSTDLVLPTRIPGRLPARTTPPTPPARSSSYGGRYSGHSGSRGGVSDGSIYVPSRPNLPTPPPRSSPFGGRYSGASGSRNTVGDGSIYNRLFGDDRFYGSRTTTTPRPRSQLGSNGYYTSHTSIDAQGNRVWTFSG